MFLSKSILKSGMKLSPLGNQTVLGPKSNRNNRPMMFTLALTSLIDAFSILVIFLLIQGPSGQKELLLNKDVQLPSVQKFSPMDEGLPIRIESGKYFVE